MAAEHAVEAAGRVFGDFVRADWDPLTCSPTERPVRER